MFLVCKPVSLLTTKIKFLFTWFEQLRAPSKMSSLSLTLFFLCGTKFINLRIGIRLWKQNKLFEVTCLLRSLNYVVIRLVTFKTFLLYNMMTTLSWNLFVIILSYCHNAQSFCCCRQSIVAQIMFCQTTLIKSDINI